MNDETNNNRDRFYLDSLRMNNNDFDMILAARQEAQQISNTLALEAAAAAALVPAVQPLTYPIMQMQRQNAMLDLLAIEEQRRRNLIQQSLLYPTANNLIQAEIDSLVRPVSNVYAMSQYRQQLLYPSEPSLLSTIPHQSYAGLSTPQVLSAASNFPVSESQTASLDGRHNSSIAAENDDAIDGNTCNPRSKRKQRRASSNRRQKNSKQDHDAANPSLVTSDPSGDQKHHKGMQPNGKKNSGRKTKSRPSKKKQKTRHSSFSGTKPSKKMKASERDQSLEDPRCRTFNLTSEEIEQAIPDNASGIFQILGRRIDFDAFPSDASLYSHLRAWVRDDPSNKSNLQTEPCPPRGKQSKRKQKRHQKMQKIESEKQRHQPWHQQNNVTDKTEASRQKNKNGKVNLSPCDVFSKIANKKRKNESVASLLEELVAKSRKIKKIKQKEYISRDKVAVKRLKSLGINLPPVDKT